MDQSLAARMFHALVVMGAALGGGCGPIAAPDKEGTSGSGEGSDPSSSTAPVDPTTTTAPASTSVGPTSTTGEAMTTTPATGSSTTTLDTTENGVIDGPEDCAFPQQFKCEVIDPPMNCGCDLDAPLEPVECAWAGQFYCQKYWVSPPEGCHCDPNAPGAPEDCPSPNNFNCIEYFGVPTQCRCDCEWQVPNPQGPDDCPGGNYYCTHDPVGCCCFIQLG